MKKYSIDFIDCEPEDACCAAGASMYEDSAGEWYRASDVDAERENDRARIAELEKALRPFALAHGHAVAYVRTVGISKPMDKRDLFMWQAGRPLCVDDFVAAAKAYGGQTMFGLTP